MLKLFLNALRDRGENRELAQDPAWHCDPLAHPAIERMSPAELADLPLARLRRARRR